MASLAKVEDVERVLETRFDNEGVRKIELLLELWSGAVRRFVGGQLIERATTASITVEGSPGRTLVLPQWPVISVTSVAYADGQTISSGAYRVTSQGLVLAAGSGSGGMGASNGGGWRSWGISTYQISGYVHGYDPIPGDVKSVVIQGVCRSLEPDSQGVSTQSFEDWAETRNPVMSTMGIGTFTSLEQDMLNRLPRPR